MGAFDLEPQPEFEAVRKFGPVHHAPVADAGLKIALNTAAVPASVDNEMFDPQIRGSVRLAAQQMLVDIRPNAEPMIVIECRNELLAVYRRHDTVADVAPACVCRAIEPLG